jgi:hypothetical protein
MIHRTVVPGSMRTPAGSNPHVLAPRVAPHPDLDDRDRSGRAGRGGDARGGEAGEPEPAGLE